MALAGLGQRGASLQGTAGHTDSNPGVPRSSTSKKGQEAFGPVSGEQAAHRPAAGTSRQPVVGNRDMAPSRVPSTAPGGRQYLAERRHARGTRRVLVPGSSRAALPRSRGLPAMTIV